MMLSPLPNTAQEFMSWSWGQIEPYYQELADRQLNPDTLQTWLTDWSNLSKMLHEMFWRLNVAVTVNTADQEAERRHIAFLDETQPPSQASEQTLKEKLLG